MSRFDVHFREEIHYMKRFRMLSSFFWLGAVSVAGMLSPQQAHAQISTKDQIAAQTELEKTIPKMQITNIATGKTAIARLRKRADVTSAVDQRLLKKDLAI